MQEALWQSFRSSETQHKAPNFAICARKMSSIIDARQRSIFCQEATASHCLCSEGVESSLLSIFVCRSLEAWTRELALVKTETLYISSPSNQEYTFPSFIYSPRRGRTLSQTLNMQGHRWRNGQIGPIRAQLLFAGFLYDFVEKYVSEGEEKMAGERRRTNFKWALLQGRSREVLNSSSWHTFPSGFKEESRELDCKCAHILPREEFRTGQARL